MPILEEQSVWGSSDETRTAYLDTQDVARMTLAALRRDATVGKVLTLSGPRAYTVAEVVALCEKLGKQEAKVTRVPVGLLKGTRAATVFFQWFADAADRLAFAEVLASNESFSAPMEETYALLGLAEADTTTLEKYLEQFYDRILKKLKEVGGSSKQQVRRAGQARHTIVPDAPRSPLPAVILLVASLLTCEWVAYLLT